MRSVFLQIIFFMFSSFCFAAEQKEGNGKVEFNFEESKADSQDAARDEDTYFPKIDQLFKNPVLASGLTSGALALDKSIESLMDSVFYSILDRQIDYKLTDVSWFSLGIKRDVYTALSGTYVVVDQMALGPRYAKQLWKIHDVPIRLGINGTVEVLNVYLRTDGSRLAEQEDLPWWRAFANNWFGLLPLLTAILPPSFNPNELYDPIRLLKTPFVFPNTLDSFNDMEIGNIRSYNLSGGVSLGLDFAEALDQKARKFIDKIQSLRALIPYSIFVEGNFRINVLKRKKDVAWVGLSKVKRMGHSIGSGLGRKIFLLTGVIPFWKGVPTKLFPIDFEISQSIALKFDHLYEYDMTVKKGQEAYLQAVRGNFALSAQYSKENGAGVIFHFTQDRTEQEAGRQNAQNLAVWGQARKESQTKGEVKITDAAGELYRLEVKQDLAEENTDVLVGKEQREIYSEVEIKVDKKPTEDRESEKSYSYVFSSEENPIQLTMSLDVQDKHMNTVEYKDAVEQLKQFSFLDFTHLPKFVSRDHRELAEDSKRRFFVDPTKEHLAIHVLPTVLGNFSAQAALYFPFPELEKILAKDENKKWKAFAMAYDADPNAWESAEKRASFSFQLQWFKAFFGYTLRLVNLRIPSVDAIKEADDSIRGLNYIRDKKTPLEKLDGYFNLFKADHPRNLARVLLLLSNLENIPRKVVFHTKPAKGLPEKTRDKFNSLNSLTLKSDVPFPIKERFRIIREKLSSFEPTEVRETRAKPVIKKIQVTSVREKNPDNKTPSTSAVHLRISVENMPVLKPAKIYIRFEQTGKIKLGKLVLAEKVIEGLPDAPPTDKSTVETNDYEIDLTGKNSPLRNFIFDQVLTFGGTFYVAMMVSSEGAIWSEEKSFKFELKDGKPLPVEKDKDG